MPVFRCESNNLPEWSEVRKIEFIKLNPGQTKDILLDADKCKLFVCEGICSIDVDQSSKLYHEGKILDLNNLKNHHVIIRALFSVLIISFAGNWGDESGDYGLFTLDKANTPKNIGDKTEYPRNTDFDNHYHDFDEYWVIYKGKGKVVTEGTSYIVNPGDCVLTRTGDHHDFPEVYDKIYGVYFETTLRGAKRLGHLWHHTP